MLQTSLLLMKSLNKIETPIFLSIVCSVFPKAIFLTFIKTNGNVSKLTIKNIKYQPFRCKIISVNGQFISLLLHLMKIYLFKRKQLILMLEISHFLFRHVTCGGLHRKLL